MQPIPIEQQTPHGSKVRRKGRAGVTPRPEAQNGEGAQGARGPPRHGRTFDEMSDADERYLPAPLVCARYNISAMSLHRWLKDNRMGLPRPLYMGRFRYWKLSELLAWERERAAARIAA